MYLRIVDDDKEWQIDIPIDETTQEALLLQSLRSSEPAFRDRFLAQLCGQLQRMLAECLDIGLQPPTEKQVKFALAIAKELAIPIPSDVLRYRDAMGNFLTRYADSFKRRRGLRSDSAEAGKNTD